MSALPTLIEYTITDLGVYCDANGRNSYIGLFNCVSKTLGPYPMR